MATAFLGKIGNRGPFAATYLRPRASGYDPGMFTRDLPPSAVPELRLAEALAASLGGRRVSPRPAVRFAWECPCPEPYLHGTALGVSIALDRDYRLRVSACCEDHVARLLRRLSRALARSPLSLDEAA